MDTDRKLELIQQQIDSANNGHPEDFDTWRDRTAVVIRTTLGEHSAAYRQFEAIRYTPTVWTSNMDTSGYRPAGVKRAISVLNAARLEVELTASPVANNSGPTPAPAPEQVFIVHGHDDARKHELARFLSSTTGSDPVILHEMTNGGRVLIEKLEHHAASTSYAVVLLTGDDVGRAKDAPDHLPRGRQNVVFEMGFFFGSLGRNRVAVLHEEGVELPGDVHGLVYIALDAAGGWKPRLARELGDAGFALDWQAVARATT